MYAVSGQWDATTRLIAAGAAALSAPLFGFDLSRRVARLEWEKFQSPTEQVADFEEDHGDSIEPNSTFRHLEMAEPRQGEATASPYRVAQLARDERDEGCHAPAKDKHDNNAG
jgi:hypothetical protein